MATQLPNQLHCHGNRSQFAFSRVTHLSLSSPCSCVSLVPFRSLCVTESLLCPSACCGYFFLLKDVDVPTNTYTFASSQTETSCQQLMSVRQIARQGPCITAPCSSAFIWMYFPLQSVTIDEGFFNKRKSANKRHLLMYFLPSGGSSLSLVLFLIHEFTD